jgi:hypothetical protein
VAILQFLAAAELLEADLWDQYNELAGIQDPEVPGGSGNPAYTKALSVLDEDMSQYIHDNADDEQSHATFINAYIWRHTAQVRSTWTSFARCPAARRLAPVRSAG